MPFVLPDRDYELHLGGGYCMIDIDGEQVPAYVRGFDGNTMMLDCADGSRQSIHIRDERIVYDWPELGNVNTHHEYAVHLSRRVSIQYRRLPKPSNIDAFRIGGSGPSPSEELFDPKRIHELYNPTYPTLDYAQWRTTKGGRVSMGVSRTLAVVQGTQLWYKRWPVGTLENGVLLLGDEVPTRVRDIVTSQYEEVANAAG